MNHAINKLLSSLSDKEILDLPLRQLPIKIKDSWVEQCISILKAELKIQGLRFSPKFYIADDWFCMDDQIGVAVPFYLFHPKLIELERKYIGEAEGDNFAECLKLLRHESAHALDNGFDLRNCSKRSEVFGDLDIDYPMAYDPDPNSKNYVRHFSDYYAQAHPEEDWAETVAIILDSENDWEAEYQLWPALQKLKYVQSKLASLKGRSNYNKMYLKTDCIKDSELTIGQYFKAKRRRLGLNKSYFSTGLKKHLNPSSRPKRERLVLGEYLTNNRTIIEDSFAVLTEASDIHPEKIQKAYRRLISECKQTKIWDKELLSVSDEIQSNINNEVCLSMKHYFKKGQHRIVM
jgi:hypothetical protein